MTNHSYESLFYLLDSIYPVSEKLQKALLMHTNEIFLRKGTVLFKIGEVASDAFFMVSGMARTYYYKEDKEITNNLCPENRVFISASSFYTGNPSYETSELLEDSEMIVIPREIMEKLCLEFLELKFMIRKLVETFYVILDQRTYFLHMKSAHERYQFLLQTNPDFFQRVPLRHIASFLGMTQETLSRLRSRAGLVK